MSSIGKVGLHFNYHPYYKKKSLGAVRSLMKLNVGCQAAPTAVSRGVRDFKNYDPFETVKIPLFG